MDHEPNDNCRYCVMKVPHASFVKLPHPADADIIVLDDDGNPIGRATLRGHHYYIEIDGFSGTFKLDSNSYGLAAFRRILPTAKAIDFRQEKI